MTKQNLIDLIYVSLSGQDKETNRFHKKTIEYFIGRALEKLRFESEGRWDFDDSFYAKEYKNVAVALDGDTELYSSTLPAAVVKTKGYQGGVVRISGMKDRGPTFVQISEEDGSMVENLNSGTISTRIQYVVRNRSVEYLRNMTAVIAAAGVRMLLIVPFEELNSTDNIAIPMGGDIELIDMVRTMIGNIPPTEQLNDNRDNV